MSRPLPIGEEMAAEKEVAKSAARHVMALYDAHFKTGDWSPTRERIRERVEEVVLASRLEVILEYRKQELRIIQTVNDAMHASSLAKAAKRVAACDHHDMEKLGAALLELKEVVANITVRKDTNDTKSN